MNEVAKLKSENQLMRSQLETLLQWLGFAQKLSKENELFGEKRSAHLQELLSDQARFFPATVTYRSPNLWASSLWIGAGEMNNREMGEKVIAKNSPVLSEGALVGVVEYVGEKQSRVRLITDSGLCPAVRSVRGSFQNHELYLQIDAFLQRIEKREDLFSEVSEKQKVIALMSDLQEKLKGGGEEYFAKGILQGSSGSLWRSKSPLLKGTGFNFDFPDEDGSWIGIREKEKPPLLKEGDLLITSGLDGVFPAGLYVAIVKKIEPLKEGGSHYEIWAEPLAGRLNDLRSVFVLPPLTE